MRITTLSSQRRIPEPLQIAHEHHEFSGRFLYDDDRLVFSVSIQSKKPGDLFPGFSSFSFGNPLLDWHMLISACVRNGISLTAS